MPTKTFFTSLGVEGWKSFQSRKLFNKLRKKNKVLLTREPGGTKSAELIRKLILKNYFLKIKKKNLINTQIHYILAARNEQSNKIDCVIKRQLLYVIDLDSTIAFKIYIKSNLIKVIHKYI